GGAARQAEIERLLRLVELPTDTAKRLPGQLSGGQKQRINLARALAPGPGLVVCDEVTSALGASLRRRGIGWLRRRQGQPGRAFLFIPHDLSLAAAFADRVLVLHRGRIVEEGGAAAVPARPSHPYTAELVRSVPSLDPHWLDRAQAGREASSPAEPGAR